VSFAVRVAAQLKLTANLYFGIKASSGTGSAACHRSSAARRRWILLLTPFVELVEVNVDDGRDAKREQLGNDQPAANASAPSAAAASRN
jgi:hypothetical protein